jgi:hypothetical protein
MADEERRSYPYFPSKNWWDLRRQFRQTMPGRVDARYLQTVLDVGEGHAKNLIPQMRAIGLIDEAGKTTQLASDWRDDETYAAACRAIVERVYPSDLTDALPPPTPDLKAAERWFARTLGVGQSAATKLAAFYRLVASGNLADERQERKPREPRAERTTRTAPKRTAARPVPTSPGPAAAARNGAAPSLHIDVQVHIPPDATAEQIDAIFAALAKHLYDKR